MTALATASRVLTRTLGPVLRAWGPGDPAFLARRSRSHADDMGALPQDHWERFLRRFGLSGLDAVLDLGCGSGDLLVPLAALNGRAVGVDADDGMLAIARARSAGGDRVEIHRMPAEALRFADDTFDAVACITALPYFDQHAAVSEIARVLRPGGRLVLGTVGWGYYAKHVTEGIRRDDPEAVRYGLDPLLVTAGRTLFGSGVAPASLRCWTPRAVRRLLVGHGFTIDQAQRHVETIDPTWPQTVLGGPLYVVTSATARA